MRLFTLKFILLSLIHSQFLIGFMASVFTYLTMYEWGEIKLPIAISVGFITWGGYAYIRWLGTYANVNKLHYKSLKHIFLPLSILFTSIGLYVLFLQSSHIILFIFLIIPPALLVLIYPLKIKSGLNVRELPGIKLSFIAFSWVWLTVSVPAMLLNVSPDWDVFTTHAQRLFILIAWTLPFDIRDIQSDDLKMQTIPQMGGIRLTKQFIYWVLFALQISFILTGIIGFTSVELSLAYILSLEWLHHMVYAAQPNKDNGFYSFGIESLPLLILLLLFIFNALSTYFN